MSAVPKKKEPVADKVYTPGDIVLAKVKGYPAWPGQGGDHRRAIPSPFHATLAHLSLPLPPHTQVIDNDMAPPAVRRERAPKDKTSYLVQFFPTGDYAWTKARDISTLSPREITSYITNPGKKSGDLLKGYKIADDPAPWNADREGAEQQRAADEAELEKDQDQLASGDEEMNGGEASKKRKRKSEAGAAKKEPDDKKAKKAKLEKLAKSRTAGAGPKKSTAQSEDEAAPVGAKKSRPTPADDEDPGLKQVKDWRHKLQKVFLGKTPVAGDELNKCKEYFDSMEKFVMTKEWLTESKLGKVLKRIALLTDGYIPNGDEFGFRTRAQALAQSWTVILGEKGESNGAAPIAAATNGSKATPTVDAPAPDAEMAPPAEEPKPAVVEDKPLPIEDLIKADTPPAEIVPDATAVEPAAEVPMEVESNEPPKPDTVTPAVVEETPIIEVVPVPTTE
ncbi:hypothetical protein P7C70_g293, partial [Phenoliferia sp. Uapishka_3]